MALRKTKIIATLGPSSETPEVIEQIIDAGANCMRLNFSHGDHESHKKKIDIVKKIREEKNVPISIMLDTKGPEFRLDKFKNTEVELKKNANFTITTDDVEGDEKRVSVNYKKLHKDLKAGDTILANDGLVVLHVDNINGHDINCTCLTGGKLSNHKSLNFPGKVMDVDYLSEKDKQDILFGIKNGIDFIACSFVSNAQNLKDVYNFLLENGGEDISLIAKIENQAGIDNLPEICEMCSAVMVARGDLGVEVPFEELPSIQKQIELVCSECCRPVITCTEMLESMIENPRPTRAETGDVATAVFEGSNAVMLSGETASGKYPVEAVKVMSKICLATEANNFFFKAKKKKASVKDAAISNAVAHAATTIATDVEAKGIVCFSDGGYVPTMISLHKSSVDVAVITPDKKTFYKLSLAWGCHPVYMTGLSTFLDNYSATSQVAKIKFNVEPGDKVVSCSGYSFAGHKFDNYVKVREF